MLHIGRYNELTVNRRVDFGLYLKGGEVEVLLPNKYVPEGTKEGDVLNVFVYTDSEDRPIATTLKPYATVGEFAYMKVKAVNNIGAFLDWGLEKDLFVPFKEQERKMEEGRSYIVFLYLDLNSDRVTASAKINRFIEKEEVELMEGDVCDLLIANRTDLGYNAIINNRYIGVIYQNEIFQPIGTGDRVKGFVKRIREDNKIDLTLQKSGGALVDDSRSRILKALKDNNGFLPLTDNSSPEEISRILMISKKAFKKTIGNMYKNRLIDIVDGGIKLVG